MLSKQKVAASDESKCVETDWKMESENIMMKTDLKSKIGIAEMSLDQVVKILDMQLVNDYYLLFTKALQSRLRSCSTEGADHYD